MQNRRRDGPSCSRYLSYVIFRALAGCGSRSYINNTSNSLFLYQILQFFPFSVFSATDSRYAKHEKKGSKFFNRLILRVGFTKSIVRAGALTSARSENDAPVLSRIYSLGKMSSFASGLKAQRRSAFSGLKSRETGATPSRSLCAPANDYIWTSVRTRSLSYEQGDATFASLDERGCFDIGFSTDGSMLVGCMEDSSVRILDTRQVRAKSPPYTHVHVTHAYIYMYVIRIPSYSFFAYACAHRNI